jgi:hypothetical protein
MAEPSPASFTKLVPGFDFLQGLVKNAGAAMPGIGQWVAPTLNPDELQKRIDELRTVQYWLEQNARLLGATIQALEVQRMTLSTLKTMNVQMDDLRESLKIRLPETRRAAPAAAPEPAPQPAPAPEAAAPKAESKPAPQPEAKTAAAPAATTPAGMVDPMQWWGALTKQFTQLASDALKDGAGDVAKNFMRAAAPAPAPATRKATSRAAPRKRAAARKT